MIKPPRTVAEARRLERAIVAAGGPRDPNLRAKFAEAQAWLDMAERQEDLGIGPLAVVAWVGAVLVAGTAGLFAVGVAKNYDSVMATGTVFADGLNLLTKVVVWGSVAIAGVSIYRYIAGKGLPPLFAAGGNA